MKLLLLRFECYTIPIHNMGVGECLPLRDHPLPKERPGKMTGNDSRAAVWQWVKSLFATSNKEKPGFWSPENLKSLFFLILLVLCFRWSIASPYHVPTASMEPTIKVGDRLLAFKLSYGFKIPFTDYSLVEWSSPKQGDIIVFRYPKEPQIDYVKRVVGIPGDRVRVESNTIYINGVVQAKVEHNFDRSILTDIDDNPQIKNLYRETLKGVEHWVMQDKPGPFDMFRSRFPPDGEFLVPEDSLFVMGDNRDNSTDSRTWGVVPMSYVRGKALFVLWSMYSKDNEFLPSFRFNRFGHWMH